jgi:hypothetical protein
MARGRIARHESYKDDAVPYKNGRETCYTALRRLV